MRHLYDVHSKTKVPTKTNVWYNTGHGHLGWTLSAYTGQAIADRIRGYNGPRLLLVFFITSSCNPIVGATSFMYPVIVLIQ